MDQGRQKSRLLVKNKSLLNKCSIVTLCIFVTVPYAQAANWKVMPVVDTSLSYTDNIFLSQGSNKSSDIIFQLNPGVSVTGTGKRLKMDLNYKMQNIAFKDNSTQNATYHQLDSKANVELVRQAFFVDIAGRYDQQFISNTGAQSYNNLAITTNTTDVGSIRVMPYLIQHFSNTADMKLSYTHYDVRYKNSPSDSQEDTLAVNLKSGKAFRQIDWSFDASRIEIKPEDRLDATLESYKLNLGYAVSSRVRTYVDLGHENNDYPVSTSLNVPSGDIWSVGVNWRPGRLTSLDVSAGRRYFGNTGTFQFNHKTRTTTWNIIYNEDITTAQQQFLNTSFGVPIDASLPSVTTELYITKRLNAGFGYKTAKSKFDFRAFNEKRIFQQTANEERVYGLQGKWDWDIKPRTKIIFAAYGQVLSYMNATQKDGQAILSATFERKMSRKLTGAIDMVHNRVDSTNNLLDYKQNIITARLSLAF